MLSTLEELFPVVPFYLPATPKQTQHAQPHLTKPAPHVAWRGELFSARSFAHVNRESILALLKVGVSIEAIPTDTHPEPEVLSWPSTKKVQQQIAIGNHAGILIEYLAEKVPPPTKNQRVVYLVVWESPLLPQEFVEAILSRNAVVWAASSPVAEACFRAGISEEKVWVLPHGVDPTVFHPGVLPRSLGLEDRFVFLFSGVAHYRKGVDIAIRAFQEEFSANEPVSLVIKDAPVSYGWGANLHTKISQITSQDSRILYLVERLPSSQMAELYTAADVVIAPSRGEGFNIPIIEAFACGKPVISTPTGVACDLRAGEEILLCEASWVHDPNWSAERSPLTSPIWLQPNVSSLQKYMRQLYTDDALRSKLAVCGSRAARRYHWEHIGAMMRSLLNSF